MRWLKKWVPAVQGRVIRISSIHTGEANAANLKLRAEVFNKALTAFKNPDSQKHDILAILSSAHPEARVTGNEVFANVDTALRHVHFYGFDYDYTLASYSDALLEHIYTKARNRLVNQGYPDSLLDVPFDRSFAVRGLHFDQKTGFLLKLDMFNKIVLDCVYHGRRQVSTLEIIERYQGTRVSPAYMNINLRMMTDKFCLPEATLYADAMQACMNHGLEFSPPNVFSDVRTCIEQLHLTGELHSDIVSTPEVLIDDNPLLYQLLTRLRNGGKRLFLLTNSPFAFVDAGMRHLLRHDLEPSALHQWPMLFDVVMCSAKKPGWFTSQSTFRKLVYKDAVHHTSLEFVKEFRRGEVYIEGGLDAFTRLCNEAFPHNFDTGSARTGSNTLYMGDHVFSDLSKPNKFANWKTCAIMPEIGDESRKMNTPEYRQTLSRLAQAERLVEFGQCLPDQEQQVAALKIERDALREQTKVAINRCFGSPFRSVTHRSLFFFEVLRYADIYTSKVNNLLQYPLDYCFYAPYQTFVHEGTDPRFHYHQPPAPFHL